MGARARACAQYAAMKRPYAAFADRRLTGSTADATAAMAASEGGLSSLDKAAREQYDDLIFEDIRPFLPRAQAKWTRKQWIEGIAQDAGRFA